MDKRKLVTVICPVYNEEECIPVFFERLDSALEPLRARYDFELLFTNNGSHDRSLQEILAVRDRCDWVQVLTLSRNFGYQASLTSGLCNARGDAIIIIDVDCEDPPEMIADFLAKWEEGYDLVYGERCERPEPQSVHMARKLFYRLTKRIADNDFILDMAEFALMTRRVRNEILRNRSTYPFIRNEMAYVGFRRIGLAYARQPRIRGTTHYNFMRMVQFAVAGILSSSTFLLRAVVYVGLPVFGLDLVALVWKLLDPGLDLGAMLLLNAMLCVSALMVTAIYQARIYKDNIQRPLFIVDSLNSHLNGTVNLSREEGLAQREAPGLGRGVAVPLELEIGEFEGA